MPIKTTLEDGSEIETYTAEELEQQREATLEEYKIANPDKTAELDALQTELKKANEDLAKFKDKDLNFSNLRTQKEAAEKKIEEVAKSIDDKIALVKKEVMEGVMQDHYKETLNSLISGDEELKKKVEFHYKRLADPTITKEEVSKKLTDAYLLATKLEDQGALTSQILASGGSKLNIKSTQAFTADEKALLQKMAQAGGIKIEEKDIK